LIYPRMYVRQLFIRFSGSIYMGGLDSLEALLRPVEQLDTEVEIGCRLSWTYD
jgi:hypothetical protein